MTPSRSKPDTPGSSKQSPEQSRGRSRTTRSPGSGKDRSDRRDRSGSAPIRARYPHIKPGINCQPKYDPLRNNKYCVKCRSDQHHPFECPKFDRYDENLCTNCGAGKHSVIECISLENDQKKSFSKN